MLVLVLMSHATMYFDLKSKSESEELGGNELNKTSTKTSERNQLRTEHSHGHASSDSRYTGE